MRSCIIIVLVCAISFSSKSQVRLNLFAGPQVSGASYNVSGVKQKTKHKYGFQVGAGLKVPFEERIYFAPAVFYSMKGYKVNFTRFAYPPDTLALDNNTLFHTVETAFLLQYDFGKQPDHFFIKAGPSLDFHLFGTEKYNTATGKQDRKIPFGYDKYGHYSANMILQLGYETKNGFFLFGHYSHGLANISNADYGPKIRHRAAGLSIGKFL